MKQTYILKSFSYRLLNDEIKKITKDSTNIIHYDLDESSLSDILEECNYISLFNEMKFIIVHDMKYFSNRGDYEKENEIISNYLEHENPNTTLIFLCNDLNLKNKNVKKIKDNNNLIIHEEIDKKSLDQIIKNYLNELNYKIDSKSLELLEKKCINNYDIILNEIDKIILTKKDYVITIDDIKNNCSNMVEDNFDFINAVVERKNDMLIHLDNLITLKTEPTIIVGQLINQFKLMYTVLEGLNTTSEEDIAKTLKIHPYRVKLAKEHGFSFGISNIENILEKLNDLDIKIKGDFPNKYLLIKNFLLDLIK